MRKRILSIVLAICLVLSCVPITVFAADEVGGEYAFLEVLKKGGTQKLDRDYKCALGHNIGKDITIDLNGHVIYYTGQNHRFSIGLNNDNKNKTLTIKDSNPNAKHTGQFADLPAGGVIVAPDGSSGGGGAVYIAEGSTFNLESGTIYNCNTTGYGGALYVLGTFNMKGGTISNCNASKSGGAVCVKNQGVFNMSGGTIKNCTSTERGGVFNEGTFNMSGGCIDSCGAKEGGGVANSSNFIMNGGTIDSCSARFGGGVANYEGGTFTMNSGTIQNCDASKSPVDEITVKDGSGGAMYISGGTGNMKGGTIESCSAVIFGGGIYSNTGESTTMDGGTIDGCSADYGGGVFAHDSTFIMSGGTIENCLATTSEGSYGFGGGVNLYYSNFTMSGGSIMDCSATYGESGALCLFANSTMTADGGSIQGSTVIDSLDGSISRIQSTSSDKYTKFYGKVVNEGVISGGVFYGDIQNKYDGTVTGTCYTVSFDSNGGSSVPPQRFVNISTATALKPTNPTRRDYVFKGWYNGSTKYTFTEPVTKSITLTAEWINTNVSTETDVKQVIDAGVTSIKLADDITLSSILDLSDKDFTLDLNGHVLKGNIKLSDTIRPTNPSKLTLIDSNPTATHTDSNLPLGGVLDGEIKLDKTTFGSASFLYANGGTVMGQVTLNDSYTQIVCTSTTPTAFMDSVGGSGEIHGGMFYGDIRQSCIEEKTVTFLSDGRRYAVGVVVSGKNAVAPIEPVKDGYVLAGWYIGDTKYNFTQPIMLDVVLNAKWVIDDVSSEDKLREAVDLGSTFIKLQNDIKLSSALDLSQKNITIDLNGYVISGADISINTGNGKASLTLKDSRPTATHTDSTLPSGGVVTSKISMKQDGGGYNDCVLYANGGTVTSEFNTNTNAVAIKCTSDTPTAFTGKISGYTHLYGGIYYGTIGSTVTIEGKKITFQNGNNTYAYEIVDGNKTVSPISPPIKSGYQTFDGWYNGNTKYTFGSSVSQDITLTAKYGNPITYSITYDLNSGEATNPESYTVESDTVTLNNPTKTGYTFTGWSGTDLTGNNNKNVTIPKGSTGNRTYTAHFSQTGYTVSFDTVGGSSISDKTGVKWTDKVLDSITNPTKNGWEFTGWKCGDLTVTAGATYSNLAVNDTVTSVTLVAQWKDIKNPVITGLENGKTYCTAVEFETSDNDGIASVKAGNDVLSADTNGKYTLAAGVGTVTVVATDHTGNTANVTVTVNNGHTYGEWQSNGDGTHTHYCTIDGCNGYEDGNCAGGEASYFKKAVCEKCNSEYDELLTDTEKPTGEISIGTNKWNSFLNTITFGIFFKDTQSVTITASDDSYSHAGYTDDKAVKVEYYLHSEDTALTVEDLAGKEFTEYGRAFNINPDNKYVVYARLTDHAGNVTYISAEGVVLDATAPVISGVENGKTYCSAQTVTVTEDYIESVKVNGTVVSLDENNQFTLNPAAGTRTIVVTDKAGNVSAEIIVTVNNGHTYEWQSENGQYWKKCKFCGDETAKKDIPTITINGADSVCVTQNYKFSFTLPEGATDASYGYEFENKGDDGLPAIIENNELFGIVPVTEYEPSENSFKVYAGAKTADGFEFIVSKTVALKSEHTDAAPKDHICDICGATLSEHTGGEATCTNKAVCEYCGEEYGEVDSSNHNLENIPAKAATVTETGNKEYWHCPDCGKYFADENGTNEIKLDDTVTQKLPPEIIEGKGQSITAGEKKELTFRSNAAFGDFIRAQLDGKTIDETNYTVREGSTVVTLKADYVATLSVGEHTIGIVSTSGTAATTFTVKAKAAVDNNTKSPQTGDNSHMALWIALLFVSGGLLTVIGDYNKRKTHSKN